MGAKPGLTGPSPLYSQQGPGRGGDPALNTFWETALRAQLLLRGPAGEQGLGLPKRQEQFPGNPSPWPQHHLLEILWHDTQIAGNVFQRDCPRQGFWNWRVQLRLGGPWAKDWHQAT